MRSRGRILRLQKSTGALRRAQLEALAPASAHLDDQGLAAEAHLVAGDELPALARLHDPVERDEAGGDRLLGAPARLRQAAELDELAELDRDFPDEDGAG